MFAWLIHPITIEDFFQNYWEKKPLHISREDSRGYYGSIFTRSHLLHKLKDEGLLLGTELKAMRYNKKTDAREDVSVEDDEEAPEVNLQQAMKMWNEGYTFQVIQPQHYNRQLWRLLTGLESTFNSLFGANAYMTPGGTQGLAPHWDDVEAFILQVEGEKEWSLFENMEDDELSGECSQDLPFDEFKEEDALMKVVVKPGDLLYFPRGTIHFANCPKGEAKDAFSNHITLSTYQGISYGNLISTMISNALDKAISTDVAFRVGLPVGFGKLFGALYSTQDAGSVAKLALDGCEGDEIHPADRTRAILPCGDFGASAPVLYGDMTQGARSLRAKEVRQTIATLLHRLADHLDLDETVDEMQEDFQRGRLPPFNEKLAERDEQFQALLNRQNEVGTKMAEFEAKAQMMKSSKKGAGNIPMPPALLKQVEEIENDLAEFNSSLVTFGPSPQDEQVLAVRLADADAVRVIEKEDPCSGDSVWLLLNSFRNDRRTHMSVRPGDEDEEGHFGEDMEDEEHGHQHKGGCCGPKKDSCCDKSNDCCDEEDEDEDDDSGIPEGCIKLDLSKNKSQLMAIRLLAEHRDSFVDIKALPFDHEKDARTFLFKLWVEGVIESKHN